MAKKRNKFSTDLGASVSQALAGARMTQSELAQSTNQSISYTNQIITGRRTASAGWCDLVADTLNLSDKERENLHYNAAKQAGYKLDLTKK